MGEIRENLKRNLGYLLTLKNISQKALSEKLGVSQSAVTNWIKGKNSPDIELIAQMCDILEVSIIDLMGIYDKNSLMESFSHIAAVSNEAHQVAIAYDAAPFKDKKMVCLLLNLPEPAANVAPPPIQSHPDSETAAELSPSSEAELASYRKELEAEEKGMEESEAIQIRKGA